MKFTRDAGSLVCHRGARELDPLPRELIRPLLQNPRLDAAGEATAND